MAQGISEADKTKEGRGVTIMNEINNKSRVPFYCSWVFIVIVTAFLWPLGAMLIWRRGQYDRKTCLNLGTISMVTGVVFMIGAIIIAYALGDTYMAFCAMYGIGGVVFARMGYEAYKKAKIYRKIIFEVEHEGVYMVPMLADEIGMPEVEVLKNLDVMFKKNLLPDYEMTRNNKKIAKK